MTCLPKLRSVVAAIATFGLLGSPVFAADAPAAPAAAKTPAAPAATLKVGDPAPALSISKWVKGEPVKEFEKGKVYVVEFWATWCGPCIVAMPHVSKLQEKYKDKGVVVIGVNIWERNGDLSKVEPFVEKQGDNMAYNVAMEEPIEASPGKGRMAMDWMKAAGRNGIPSSFIVDQKGDIAWMGHPMKMDKPLEEIVAGTFDAKAYAEMAAKIDALSAQATEATRGKDYDKALELRDALAELDPASADMQKLYKLSLLKMKGDDERVATTADELLATAEQKKEAQLAGNVAILMMQSIGGKSDPARALKAAQTAYDLGDKSTPFLGLLARAHAANGQYGKAIELQEKVVEQSSGPVKEREKKMLESYKSKNAI